MPVLIKASPQNILEIEDITQRVNEISPVYGDIREGYVIRLESSFYWENNKYYQPIMKYVRANHVTTDKHWRNQKIKVQRLQ